jgi:hypothetical protein
MMALLTIAGLSVMDWLVFEYLFKPVYLQFKRIMYLHRHGEHTTGSIVDYVIWNDADGKDQFAPVVQFRANDGKEYVIKSDDYRFSKPETAKLIKLCYEPGNPSNAITSPGSQSTFKAFLLVTIVVVLLVLNAGMFYKIFF